MKTRTPSLSTLAALCCAAASSPVWSAGPSALAEAQQRYQADRAACIAGDRTPESRAACMKEAAAALAEARRGLLDDREQAQYRANAMERCRTLPADDRASCEARMAGAGTTRGSVEGGGIYRELVERRVGEVPPAGGAALGSGTAPAQPAAPATSTVTPVTVMPAPPALPMPPAAPMAPAAPATPLPVLPAAPAAPR